MVQKIKHVKDIARRNAPSKTAKKKMKQEYKGKRKDNYKKKKENTVECCICFSQVKNCSDNSVICGKTVHSICGACKIQCRECGSTKCPMCRSHDLPMPIAQDVNIKILSVGMKFAKPVTKYYDMKLSPKERRHFFRHRSPYNLPFTCNSNQIVRERKNWTGRHLTINDNWFTDARVRHYNGSDSDSSSDSDSDSDSDADSIPSTLTLIEAYDSSDDTDEELYEIAAEVERIVMGYD